MNAAPNCKNECSDQVLEPVDASSPDALPTPLPSKAGPVRHPAALQDSAAVCRMLCMLYDEGDWFYVMTYTEKGVRKKWAKNEGQVFGQARLQNITNTILSDNAKRLGVATSVGSFQGGEKGNEIFCTKLKALAVDIDEEDIKVLAPNATSLEEVAEIAFTKLKEKGLTPHAIIRSGHGLHVYLLIEPVILTNMEERVHAKGVWRALGEFLGGATDRYDLASRMRLPGTVNGKNNESIPVSFLDKYTDETRRRYGLLEIEGVVGYLECTIAGTGKARSGSKSASKTKGEAAAELPISRILSVENQVLLDAALELDKMRKLHTKNLPNGQNLNYLRAQTRDPDQKIDHSVADFAYACRLLQCGMPSEVVEVELVKGIKANGASDGEAYCRHTLKKVKLQVQIAGKPMDSRAWHIEADSNLVTHKYYSGSPQAVPIEQLFCGEFELTPDPVIIKSSRPGDGKTYEAVEGFTRQFSSRQFEDSHIIMLGEFKRELLPHEARINCLHPMGRQDVLGGGDVDISTPETAEELVQLLKLEAGTPEYSAAMGTRDLCGFYLNTRHPLITDERRFQDDDKDMEDAMLEAAGEPIQPREVEKVIPPPFAVLKFRGTPDYCMAGHPAEVLNGRKPPCGKDCPHVSCRANSTKTEGNDPGAKTYWKGAKVALLTHQGFAVQEALIPESNRCDEVWSDEVPPLIFRRPKFTIYRTSDQRGVSWSVRPLDLLIHFAEEVLKSAKRSKNRLTYIVQRLKKRRERLVKRAQERCHLAEQSAKEKKPAYDLARIDQIEPLLAIDDFRYLVERSQSLGEIDVQDDFPITDGVSEMDAKSPHASTEALCTLKDFCGDQDAKLNVYLWFGRSAKGEPILEVTRPVNGWKDLLGPSKRKITILDATAGIDPRYLLAGQFAEERFPKADFPNTRVVLVPPRSKSKIKVDGGVERLIQEIREHVAPYLGSDDRLLILTNLDSENDLLGRVNAPGYLPCKVTKIAHFGNLRGRNDFKDFTAVYFTNPYRYQPNYYTCLGLLVDGFRLGKDSHRKPGDTTAETRISSDWIPRNGWKRWDSIEARSVVSDLYQDALRIRIRTDPKAPAHIFVPTYDCALVTRLMQLLPGAGFEVFKGPELRQLRGAEWHPVPSPNKAAQLKVEPGSAGRFYPLTAPSPEPARPEDGQGDTADAEIDPLAPLPSFCGLPRS